MEKRRTRMERPAQAPRGDQRADKRKKQKRRFLLLHARTVRPRRGKPCAEADTRSCRSSDCDVQALSRQRAGPAFSPPRYRTSMTRFRGTHISVCAEPALRLHSYRPDARSVWPVSGILTRFPCPAGTRMRVRTVLPAGSRICHKSRKRIHFLHDYYNGSCRQVSIRRLMPILNHRTAPKRRPAAGSYPAIT